MVAAATRHAVPVADALRVDDGRYWSYTCTDPACCSPEGARYDVAASPVAAAATVAGVPVPPNQEALAAHVAPIRGPARQAMREATARAEARRRTEFPHRDPTRRAHAWRAEGRRRLVDAVAAYAAGDQLDDDNAAWLAVLATSTQVRDAALVRLTRSHDRAADLALWLDITRRCDRRYVPAPATLAAFTAWQSRDYGLAHLAVDQALHADPTYRMARLVQQALAVGLPPADFTASVDDLPTDDQ